MNHNSSNRNSQLDLPRCQHYIPSGRHYRFPVSGARSTHCLRHAVRRSSTPSSTDDVLISALLIQLAHDLISARRAAVLAYFTNQLLRTLPAIDKELNPESPDDPAGPTLIFDLPRPDRSRD